MRNEHYLLEGNGTVSELFEDLGDMYKAVVYKGSGRQRSVAKAKWTSAATVWNRVTSPSYPRLRRHEEALASQVMHLVEISELSTLEWTSGTVMSIPGIS